MYKTSEKLKRKMESVNDADLDAEKWAERDALLKAIEDAAKRIQVR